MDSKDNNKLDIVEILKQPYTKMTLAITVIIIIAMYLTQSLWMNIGIGMIYKEYKAEDILPTNDIPNGVFILSGNYTYISEWINTSKLNCDTNRDVKLVVYSINERGMTEFKNIVVMDAIEGCNK